MTAIIGVLNSQAVAIAADSAATVTSGNIKKVYNKSNKIFTLSKYHPVGIAIFNSSQFMGIPWETLIKMYRKQLKSKSFNTVEKYKLDFLSFLPKNLVSISNDFKKNNFYSFCRGDFNSLKERILGRITENENTRGGMSDADFITHLAPIISQEIVAYKATIDALPKNDRMNFTIAEYTQEYKVFLDEIVTTLENEIKSKITTFNLSDKDKELVIDIFYNISKVENIFEQSSGLVFVGFGEKEIYPSSQQVIVGSVIKNIIRYRIEDPNIIIPGTYNADIISYAQRDVTMTILKGIDPTFQGEIDSSLTQAFKSVSTEVVSKIPDANDATAVGTIIEKIASTLTEKLEAYRYKTITQPFIEILNFMGKEDMAELAESLVSITSLKRKFTLNSSDESVGGPVDVAVITKGDGFIWIKRKHYFDFNLNKGFMDKYYNEKP